MSVLIAKQTCRSPHCGHDACTAARRIAGTDCEYCRQPIGFNRPFLKIPYGMVRERCYDERHTVDLATLPRVALARRQEQHAFDSAFEDYLELSVNS